MKSDTTPKVINCRVNLGSLPYFSKGHHDCRAVSYHVDHFVEKFPRIRSSYRIHDALEMNLFLEQRYKGSFMPPKRGGNRNVLGGVTVLTLSSIAHSLCLFLNWLESEDVHWEEVYAVSPTEKAKYWLPIYRYRKFLIHRVKERQIDRNTGNLYMNHIRQFYEWALRTQRIHKVPFKYKTLTIKKTRRDGDLDLLFASSAALAKGITVTTTDLLIPKKYRQKRPLGTLTPWTSIELKQLYGTDTVKPMNRRLWIDLALQCGLRAIEIATFPSGQIVDPDLFHQRVFHLDIEGKFGKIRSIMVSRPLMKALWHYLNHTNRQKRLGLWQMQFGGLDGVPLFLNRSGQPITSQSVGNIISKARMELKKKGILLKKSFHDLRSTFATNLASFMLNQNLPPGFIQFKLMQLLGHADFSTTQKYLNFAQAIPFNQQMASWVNALFDENLDGFHQDLKDLKGE